MHFHSLQLRHILLLAGNLDILLIRFQAKLPVDPGQSLGIRGSSVVLVAEDYVHLFEGLAGSFGESKEDKGGTEEGEDTKDDEGLPGDVLHHGGSNLADDEVVHLEHG